MSALTVNADAISLNLYFKTSEATEMLSQQGLIRPVELGKGKAPKAFFFLSFREKIKMSNLFLFVYFLMNVLRGLFGQMAHSEFSLRKRME